MQTFWDTVVASRYVLPFFPLSRLRTVCVDPTKRRDTNQEKHRACHKEYKDGATFVDSYDEGAKKLSEKTCKFLLTTLSSGRRRSQGRYCGVMAMTGEACVRTGASFLLPRGSKLSEAMGRATLNMTVAGAIPTAAHFMRATCAKGGAASLTLKQLFLFFAVAFAACFVVFLVMMLHPQGAPPPKPAESSASIPSV